MLIKAQVRYDLIKKLNNGLYCWMNPSEETIFKFSAMKKLFPAPEHIKYENSTELHCTLLYHKDHKLPDNPQFPVDAYMKGRVVGVDQFNDCLVALVESPEIQSLHASLKNAGFRHSYPEYKPHITFAKEREANGIATRIFMSELNEFIGAVDFDITLGPCLFGDTVL